MMTKELRQKVYNKYHGHCAYCGNEIKYKDMQVDHIFPQSRKHFLESEPMKKLNGLDITDINDISNLNPSCRRCNHYKRAMTIREFRYLLTTLHKRVSQQYINKVAIDYGVIKIQPFDGVFYYEREAK